MRLKQLDILRGIAVCLVIFHHWDDKTPAIRFFYAPFEFIRSLGWIGVDLFFVLSGFLVAGLLFKEISRSGEIKFKRFFIRRGLKIYPAFYAFLIILISIPVLRGRSIEWSALWHEAAFVQNYGSRLQPHTWSLAVEEHFYLLLPITLIGLLRWNRQSKELLHGLPLVCLLVALVAVALRALTSVAFTFNVLTHVYATHLRIDSLAFGVLLSYYYYFKQVRLESFFTRIGWKIYPLALFLILPALILPVSNVFIHTVGFTLLYVGFGCLLLGVLRFKRACSSFALKGVANGLALIGFYSYSIYLWHFPIRSYGGLALTSAFGSTLPFYIQFAIYFASSIIFGVLMAKVVELPFLKLRDRLFPSFESNVVSTPERTHTLAPQMNHPETELA